MLKSFALTLSLLPLAATGSTPTFAKPNAVQDDAPAPRSIWGQNKYIEYLPGTGPVIITAPHGGQLMPESIPDRTPEACGGSAITVRDTNTTELTRAIRAAFYRRYGFYPHVVLAYLSRKKMDANRSLEEAACGSAEAAQAFKDWHNFIEQAERTVIRDFGKGWYMDIHGHGHPNQRVEIGYLLKTSEINYSDAKLDADPKLRDRVSVRNLLSDKIPLSEMLRGPKALGSLFEREGIPAVPSDADPRPGDEKYFSAGYNTLRHTCSTGAAAAGSIADGKICGLQFETHWKGLRDIAESRRRFGDVLALTLGEYLKHYYDLDLSAKKR
ncbi:hypothetical protein ACFSC3_00900 [Sphingomonas floccifaciens]|uniref:N-formylglutamate amidohydrolase n=1 Tax=Sphingomonas floccifaciens TaxID=1844115 RepID=A0ABW4N880_9SPHN